MVTTVPAGPLLGVNLVRVAAHVKFFTDVAFPLGVLTEIGPIAGQAPAGIVAWILVEFNTVNGSSEFPLNQTAVASVKPLPVIVTLIPTEPLLGVKLPRAAAAHVKFFVAADVPLGVLTETRPVPGQATAGTAASIRVGLRIVNPGEGTPLN